MEKLRDQILSRKKVAEDSLITKRELWTEVEKLFHNQLTSSVATSTKSRVFDPKLTTLVLERGYRVMSQLPTGKVRAISTNDQATSTMMNLILDKYIVPHANAQFDFLTKLRMIDIYSNLYGNFFALVDWDIKKNGYIGPDLWLLNIRDIFPQVGAVSIEDSDYIIVRTWKPLSYFEGLSKQNGFKNVGKIITKLKDLSGSKQNRSDDEKSAREKNQYPSAIAAKEAGYFEVLTQYEGDRWVDFCVDADLEFRDIKNPHDNGELPVVCKYSIPLIDDFMGMGDFERGKSMQMVVNSIWNLYLDATKMSIFPPMILNKDNIAAMSSIKYGAAEKWLGRGQVSNVAQPVNLSPKGIETFNNTYQVANAALLNMFGTSDTTVTSQTEAGFGKTPEALRMQGARENTRDNADRFYMEQFLKKVMTKMVNLVSKKQMGPITFRLFGDDFEKIKRTNPELEENFDIKTGKLTIDKEKTGSVVYDYEIVSGSTYAVDQQSQQQNMVMLLQLLLKSPELIQMISQEGYTIKMGELFKRVISNSGVQDWDKILEEKTEQEKAEAVLQDDAERLAMAIEQMQMQQGPVGANMNMNQIPTPPNEITNTNEGL
jgi:hypothetical protein